MTYCDDEEVEKTPRVGEVLRDSVADQFDDEFQHEDTGEEFIELAKRLPQPLLVLVVDASVFDGLAIHSNCNLYYVNYACRGFDGGLGVWIPTF